MRRLSLSIMLCMVLLFSLLVPVVAADTATLTIEPDKTQVTMDGTETKITYTITVTPPTGKEIGVFSFRLKPSGDMTLPQNSKNAAGDKVIQYVPNDLSYDVVTGEGVFRTYEYTPESNFFAAVGTTEGNRMKSEAQILVITATIPAGSSGVYAMDAEFTVAPDGSGETYIGKVVSAPVTVGSPGKTGDGGNNSLVVTDLDEPRAGETPDGEVTVTAPGEVKSTTTWFCDGEEMKDPAFTAGHVYTVVIRVETAGGAFDPEVYANQGYTVTRLSDTVVELRRSFAVEAGYAQEVTEEEAAALYSSRPSEEEAAAPETVPMDGEEAPQSRGGWIAAAVIIAAAAAAGVVFARCRKKRTE